MLEDKIRANLLSFISIPKEVSSSQAYKLRSLNVNRKFSHPTDTKLRSGMQSSQIQYEKNLLNSDTKHTYGMYSKSKNCIGNSSKIQETLSLIDKNAFSFKESCSKNVTKEVQVLNGAKLENRCNFSKIDFSLKPVKSRQAVIQEKADLAEKYLCKIGKELKKLRFSCQDSDVTNFSNCSSVTEASPVEKKKKIVKKKIRRTKKKGETDIKKLTLNLILLEAELDTKEKQETLVIKKSIRKCSSLDKRNKYPKSIENKEQEVKINITSHEKILAKETKIIEEGDDEYINQFKNYKIRQVSNAIESEATSKSNNMSESTTTSRDKTQRKRKIRKVKSFKKSRKITCKTTSNALVSKRETRANTNSTNVETMNEEDFNTFFDAYDNHQKIEKMKLSTHKASDLSTQNFTEQSDSSIFNKRKSSMKVHRKQNKSISYFKDQTVCSSSNEFKIYPLPTQNMLNVINCLKEIEDEIEDDE